MKTIKGPAIFLAQFVGSESSSLNLSNIAQWAANLGFEGVQIRAGKAACSICNRQRKVRLIAMM